jgi:hypothetical protein
MRFFFDRNMLPRLARMIDIYERDHRVRHHDEDERLGPTTADIEWIRLLGTDDPAWVVISGDGRILRNKAESKALTEARLTFFCMSKVWTHMSIHESTWKFVRIWPEIVESAKVSTPKIFQVTGTKVDLYR